MLPHLVEFGRCMALQNFPEWKAGHFISSHSLLCNGMIRMRLGMNAWDSWPCPQRTPTSSPVIWFKVVMRILSWTADLLLQQTSHVGTSVSSPYARWLSVQVYLYWELPHVKPISDDVSAIAIWPRSTMQKINQLRGLSVEKQIITLQIL